MTVYLIIFHARKVARSRKQLGAGLSIVAKEYKRV